MNIGEEFFEIIIIIAAICVVWTFVIYFTKNGKNFRSSRNKRARKQL